MDEIDTAFANSTTRNGNRWEGTSRSGPSIRGYVNDAGEIVTAYPKGP
jgi:hypothetical protein